MYIQIGCGAGEVLIQQSVSTHACKEEAELCAEEGQGSPKYTVQLGEGLDTTLFTGFAAAARQVQTVHSVFGKREV